MKVESGKLCTELEETTEILPANNRANDLLEGDTVPKSSPLPESNAESSWEDQLNICKQRIDELQEKYGQSYLEIGRVLIQARNVYKGHGDWGKWLTENVSFSVRHAQRLIRVAEMLDAEDTTLVSQHGLTSSKAYILTRIGKNDLNSFFQKIFRCGGKTKFVKDMTKRELEQAVTRFLKDKLESAASEETALNRCEETQKRGSVESNLQKLKLVLDQTIASIMGSDSDTRDSWISEFEDLCKAGLEQLEAEAE